MIDQIKIEIIEEDKKITQELAKFQGTNLMRINCGKITGIWSKINYVLSTNENSRLRWILRLNL
jgi:hypothetical protein